MSNPVVNNHKAARRLDVLARLYIHPLESRIKQGRLILDNDKYPWKNGEKEKAKKLHQQLEGRLINYQRVYLDLLMMVQQHESIATKLVQMYYEWYEIVSVEGKQPNEMISIQTEKLQSIFSELYSIIEPIVKNEIKAPDNG